jgi:protein TonB
MRKLLVASLLLFTVCLHAQNSNFTDTRKPFVKNDTVYVEAGFPGGNVEWIKYLEHNLHSETAAKHKAPPGNYTVTVSFLVDKTGKVVQVKALNDPGYGTAEDAIKVIEHCPDWLPATINGKRVFYRQKQNFTYQVTEK